MSGQEINGKPPRKYFKDEAVKSLFTFLIWASLFILILFVVPIFYTDSLRFLSPILEMIGLSFLIIDENYLLSNNSLFHIKYSNIIHSIINSYSNISKNYGWFKRFKVNAPSKNKKKCDITFTVQQIKSVRYGTDIPEEQFKEMYDKISKISKHSIVRKTGYFIMGLGFLYQLIYIICN